MTDTDIINTEKPRKHAVASKIQPETKAMLNEMLTRRYIASTAQCIELGIKMVYRNYKQGISPVILVD